MKKIYLFTILAAFLAVSCAKEMPGNDPEFSGEEVLLSFKTTTPGVTAEKTILGDETGTRTISWAPKDSVKIYYGTTATAYKEAEVENNGDINLKVSTASKFYAVYPNTAEARMQSNGFDVTIPVTQNGEFSKACLMAAYAGADRLLRFQVAVSMLTIEVTDPAVTKIVIRANDGTPIAGTTRLAFSTETGEITTVTNQSNVSKEITLNVSGVGKYYVGILPNVNLACGIGFNVFKGEKAYGTLSGTPLQGSNSAIVNIGAVDTRLLPEGDLYIKANGSGNGSSWTEAAGPATLKNIVGVKNGFDGVTSGWRLAGKTVYVAKGEYELGTSGNPFLVSGSPDTLRIIGGFYEGSAGKDLDKYDPEQYPTVFTAPAEDRIMKVSGSGALIIKGITFSGASNDENGAAIFCDAPDVNVLMEDCFVSNNITSKNGAGIYVSAGTFKFDRCSFSGNKATTSAPSSTSETADSKAASRGGAILAVGTSSKLFFNECSFRSNIAFAGADIQLQNGADAFVYRSSFLSSVATALSYHSVYPGRSVDADAMASGTSGKICMCNCTITKTSSAYTGNGGLPLVSPTDYFCMMVENTLHDGAIASLRNNNSRLSVKDANLVWVIANLFVNSSGNAINLASSSNQHGFYNIMEKGKNSYATLAETDSQAAESDFSSMKLDSNNGIYRWSLESKPFNKPTRTQISDLVKDNCLEFHNWLTSLNDNPFGIDQLGTVRNPGSVYPGSWDPGM